MRDAADRPLARLPFTLPALRAAYADGVRPREVVAEVLSRLAAVDDPGIFLHLPGAEDLGAAADALGAYDPARPLWGIPFAVKDNIDVAGWPTTAACPAFAYTATRDATVVAQLREAGALPVGKTNLDQFATGLVGVRTPYPVPRNAVDPAIVPGGSSSGSAVAVAHGIVPFALGTDTAGSGRVPAALNGLVGLKPSLGALSTAGVVPACRTLDTVSVFARSVADAWDAARAGSGFDAGDPFSRHREFGPRPAPLPAPRLGVPTADTLRVFGDRVQAAAFQATIDRLAMAGAQVVEVDLSPLYAVAELLYDGPWVAERLAAIAPTLASDPDAVHPVTRQIVAKAKGMTAVDAFEGRYKLAALQRQAEALFAGIDLLCVPSIPTFYTCDALAADPIGPNSRLGTYTNFVNLLDLAAVAVPTGPRADGRPGSVTLIAAGGRDAAIAAEAARLEALVGGTPPRADAPGTDELAIAVCGAHMSGLPLNGELSRRGGRFLHAARTAPVYRLYALAGGPPARPGLVRQPDGGAAIAVEVWALPATSVGGLLAEIPAPLGLGRVRLEDGSDVAGFLCEPAGLAGAREITHLGDWRLFLEDEA